MVQKMIHKAIICQKWKSKSLNINAWSELISSGGLIHGNIYYIQYMYRYACSCIINFCCTLKYYHNLFLHDFIYCMHACYFSDSLPIDNRLFIVWGFLKVRNRPRWNFPVVPFSSSRCFLTSWNSYMVFQLVDWRMWVNIYFHLIY